VIFYLGTHASNWLTRPGRPLFVSAVRLRKVKRWPVAQRRWALDSGGFTELSLHGRSADSMAWSFTARRRPVRLDGCTHKTCANCPRWAEQWAQKVAV